MKKNDFINLIQQSYLVTSKADAERVIDLIFGTIKKEVAEGRSVKIPGFGIWYRKQMNARIARNPLSGEKVQVPAQGKVKFTVALAFKDLVK